MANEIPVHFDGVAGTLSAAMGVGVTTMASTGLENMGTVDAAHHAKVALFRLDGVGKPTFEILHVTAHVDGAPTATVLRAQAGTTALAWDAATKWTHGPQTADIDDLHAALAAEAALARNADNLTSGTVADARIASTIARDSDVTTAIAASELGQVRDGDGAGGVLSGTYPSPGFAVDMATQAELDAAISGLSGTYDQMAGDATVTGLKTWSRTAPDLAQTVTATFTAVPDTGGAQGLIFDRTNDARPLGLVFKTAGVPQNAIAMDAGTSDIILSWSPLTPGDQLRIAEGGFALFSRSVGHPPNTARLKIDAVGADPAAMVDLLYLAGPSTGPATRLLRITNETDTLLAVKADNSGVGIGTLTPGAQLHVLRSQDATTQVLLANGNNTASARASARIQSAAGSLFLESYPALFATPALAGHSFVYTTGSSDLILGTAGTDRWHMTAAGKLGIGGVATPAAQVDILASTNQAVLRLAMFPAQSANPFVIVDSAAAAVMAVSSAGRVFAFTGSAAGAGFAFLSDPDTGLFSNAVDNLQFTAGGAERGRFSTTAFQLTDAINLVVGSTTGTKIGTATTQKLGLWNATPVVQPTGIADVSGGATVDAEVRTAFNALLAKLEAVGLLAVA